jgi:hypothetical protein
MTKWCVTNSRFVPGFGAAATSAAVSSVVGNTRSAIETVGVPAAYSAVSRARNIGLAMISPIGILYRFKHDAHECRIAHAVRREVSLCAPLDWDGPDLFLE